MKEKEVQEVNEVENVVEIKNLCKKYRGFALDNVSLTLQSGCITGLIGENGAGKSTTIKLILGMMSKDSGSIKIFNKKTNTLSNIMMEDIGVVFDELCLPTNVSAMEINSIMKRIYKNWDEEKYVSLLERLNVSKYKYLKELSRGNKMKVNIAVALSHNPKLLILDEATNGLDPVIRDEIIDIFMEFTKDEGNSIILSSHIVSDLEKACDYIAFLNEGKLIMHDEKDVLKDKYRIIKCSEEEFEKIDSKLVLGYKKGNYGVSALVKKEAVFEGVICENITIEDLFIYIIRESNKNKEKKVEINYRKRKAKRVRMCIYVAVVLIIIGVSLYRVISEVRIKNTYKNSTNNMGYIEFNQDRLNSIYLKCIEESKDKKGNKNIGKALKKERKIYGDFYSDVMNIKGVTAVGNCYTNLLIKDKVKGLDKLIKIQQTNKKTTKLYAISDEEDFGVVSMNREAFSLFNVEIAKGKKISELKKDDTLYMYLGSEYSHIKIGTEYTNIINDKIKNKIVVAGILKKGSKVVDETLDYDALPNKLDIIPLDYSGIIITSAEQSRIYYSVKDKDNVEEIGEKILEKSKKYGLDGEILNLEKMIDDKLAISF